MKTVRELAKSLGLSHTTVSDALRNNPRVKAATREKVQAAAREAGYNYNPLAGALMSEMRRSKASTFRGVLAVVDLEKPEDRHDRAQFYHKKIIDGARQKAEVLGFKTESFVLGREKLSISRLDSILRSRGIRGLLLLPAGVTPDISNLDWDNYAGVYTDYIIERPALDSVCSDHFRSMVLAMQKLAELGYRRPGLVMHKPHDSRLLHRWEAAYLSFIEHHQCFDPLPVLLAEELTEGVFVEWFQKEDPDVVLCHQTVTMDWMRKAGASIPRTHGFCCLNTTFSHVPVTGLNLQPNLIGQRGIEMVIAQLHRNEYGIPGTAATITIPAAWVDGPTVKKQNNR